MEYHLYHYFFPPLDWTFCFFTIDEFKQRIKNYPDKTSLAKLISDEDEFINNIDLLLEEAEAASLKAGWNGDYRNPPMVFALPAGDACSNELNNGKALLGIIINQDNNGDTFVYSPVELKHLFNYS